MESVTLARVVVFGTGRVARSARELFRSHWQPDLQSLTGRDRVLACVFTGESVHVIRKRHVFTLCHS